MPQISPMNWMLMFMFFVYMILFMKKMMIHESFKTLNISFLK